MSAQKNKTKKQQRIYDLLNAEAKPNFFRYRIRSKEKVLMKKYFLKKIRSRGMNKKQK